MNLFNALKDLMVSIRELRLARAELPKVQAQAEREIAEAEAQTEQLRRASEAYAVEIKAKMAQDEIEHQAAMTELAQEHARTIAAANARSAILSRMEAGEITLGEALAQMNAHPI
jgi:hypothetical protein